MTLRRTIHRKPGKTLFLASMLGAIVPLGVPDPPTIIGSFNNPSAAPRKQVDTPLPVTAGAAMVGKKVPSLPGFLETGESLDLAALQAGTPGSKPWVVLYFWSSQCPCVRSCQNLTLFPLYKKYAGRKDVRFFAVASNASDMVTRTLSSKQQRTSLRDTQKSPQNPPYPVILDPQHRIANALGADSTPECYLISPEGRVVFCGNADDEEELRRSTGNGGRKTQNYLEDALTQALAGKEIRRGVSPALGCEIDRGRR